MAEVTYKKIKLDGYKVQVDSAIRDGSGKDIASTYATTESVPTQLSQLTADSTHRLTTDIEKGGWNAKYTKPSTGIPKTDLTSTVQGSLDKADSAYQKATTGIPKTDLASTVQGSLDKADSAYQVPSGGIPSSDMSLDVQSALSNANTAYQVPSGGIPSSQMTSAVQISLGKADGSEQTSNRVTSIGTPNDTQYPTAKAVQNFVNSSINALASYYITKNAEGKPFSTYAELQYAIAHSEFYSGGASRTPTKNDYCIVLADEVNGDGNSTRYIFTTQWEFQYLFNYQFSPDQMNVLDSGITSTKVEKYDGYETAIASKAEVKKYSNVTITFASGATTATASFQGMTSDGYVIVAPTQATASTWYAQKVYCSGQADGSLTFTGDAKSGGYSVVVSVILII